MTDLGSPTNRLAGSGTVTPFDRPLPEAESVRGQKIVLSVPLPDLGQGISICKVCPGPRKGCPRPHRVEPPIDETAHNVRHRVAPNGGMNARLACRAT